MCPVEPLNDKYAGKQQRAATSIKAALACSNVAWWAYAVKTGCCGAVSKIAALARSIVPVLQKRTKH